MLFTRRQIAIGLVGGIWISDPLQEIAHVLQRASTPGWFGPPEITASVVDICYEQKRLTKGFGAGTSPDTLFVVGSITKPMVATAVMVLHDRRELTLEDRVTKFFPKFQGGYKEQVTIRHLLTHTAGLPDNLPNGHELLRHGMNLDDFFLQTCKLQLLFKPGRFVSYSNLGVLVAQQIIERVGGTSLSKFLRTEVFRPLSMDSTSLGLGQRNVALVAENQTSDTEAGRHQEPVFSTPWGGVYSTAADVTRFLQYFANPGSRGPLRPESAKSMLQNQTPGLNQPWGIGWMMAYSHDVYYKIAPSWRRYGWAAVFGNPERLPAFGVNCSPSTFGHYGVTGTIAWADPERQISIVLLTTKKVRFSRDGILGPVSDLASRLS